MQQPEVRDFRLYLQNQFIHRCKKNPQYSLRAYARFLSIESSALSKLLSGKRTLTLPMHYRLGEKLGLARHEIEQFSTFEMGKEGKVVGPEKVQPAEYHDLSIDMFQIISDWYHYAILELVKLKHFKADFKWISKVLNISVTEAKIATERLERVGLLDRSNSKKWKLVQSSNTTLGNEFTTVAFKRLQKQLLHKAIDVLDGVPLSFRDQTAMTMAIDVNLLPEAKKKITSFRRSLSAYLQKTPDLNHVYQLTISLYPLTPIDFNRKEKHHEN